VTDALTSPFAVAAIVLVVAGLAKLRSPAAAARALDTLGVSAGAWMVRAIALGEIALGGWAVVRPEAPAALAVAAVYGAFAVVAWLLASREASCGCFGEREHPASLAQSVLSIALASAAGLAAIWRPRGLSWLATHPVVALGVAGAAYATVLAYTVLPLAWSAWIGATQ
jgi:Mg/Co/Ni transporter MgtE